MNRIQELRQERGLSLQQLSKAIKEETGETVSKASLSNYEREDQQPKKETWKLLADFFHVNLSYIMGLSPNRNPIEEHLYKSDISRLVELTNGDLENAPQMRKVIRTIAMLLDNTKNKKEYIEALYNLVYAIFVLNPYPDNDSITIDPEGEMRTPFEIAKLINDKRCEVEKSLDYFVKTALDQLDINKKHRARHKKAQKIFGDPNSKPSPNAFEDYMKRMEAFNDKANILDEENFKKADPRNKD